MAGQTILIWASANERWQGNIIYDFSVKHRPRTGIISFQISTGGTILVDSGDIQVNVNSGLSGGRVGAFTLSQDHSYWTDLTYSCQGNVFQINLQIKDDIQ